MRIIVVAGSECNTFKNYKYQENDFFIGIEDGGYEIIKRGFSLDLAVGDFDTTSHLSEISASAKQILKYSPIKNEIDLELALIYIKEHYPNEEVYIYNATQGRMDHELITIKLLIKFKELSLHLINNNEEIIYINKPYLIDKPNTRFSLITFENVTLEIINAQYPLAKSTLAITDNFTSSNKTKDNTLINIYNGGVILVINA